MAFTEIRHCGADNIQRAVIENLMQTLPEHHHPALQQELATLDGSIQTRFSNAEDLALARIPHSQGWGAIRIAKVTTALPRPVALKSRFDRVPDQVARRIAAGLEVISESRV